MGADTRMAPAPSPCGSLWLRDSPALQAAQAWIEILPSVVSGLVPTAAGVFPSMQDPTGFFFAGGALLPISTTSHAGHHVPVTLPRKVFRCLLRSGKAPVFLQTDTSLLPWVLF